MPGSVFLNGDTVTLRTVEAEDVDFLCETANDPRVRRPMFVRHKSPYTRADQREWIEEMTDREDSLALLVCVEGDPVGSVALTEISPAAGTAELSYYVAPDAQGNGYATDSLRVLLAYAFDQRRLHKVIARTYEFNEASQGLLEKLGFVREGVGREEGFLDGEYRDVYRYGLLDRELVEQ